MAGAPPPNGDLARTSAVHLYYLAASGDHTGLLTLKLPDRAIEVHFRKGNPEYVGSSHLEDSVGAFLLNQSLVTPEQIAQAEITSERFGGDLIATLFSLGTLNPGTAFAHIAQRAGGLLLHAFGAEQGTFTFEDKDLSSQRAIPLGNRWAVLSDQVRRIPISSLKRRLEDALDLPVMKSSGQVQAADLRLTPQETRALSYIDGVRSLNQLMRDLPQSADHFIRVAFLLQELEMVSFAAVAVRASSTHSPTEAELFNSPAPVPPTPTPKTRPAPEKPKAAPPVLKAQPSASTPQPATPARSHS
jgi:hypothetical protein